LAPEDRRWRLWGAEEGGVEGRSIKASPTSEFTRLLDALADDAAPKVEVPGANGGLPFKAPLTSVSTLPVRFEETASTIESGRGRCIVETVMGGVGAATLEDFLPSLERLEEGAAFSIVALGD
jgi:hypothetical protein